MQRIAILCALGVAACAQDTYFSPIGQDVHIPADFPNLEPAVEDYVLSQRIPEKVDVLWLIDDSISMLAEQNELADNAASFLQTYRSSGLDWHIGVITTNMRDDTHMGKLQGGSGFRWVDPTVPDPVSVFQSMAVVGRDGPSAERGRDAIYASMTAPDAVTHNHGFFRDEARLTIIIVSDEDDASESIDLDTFELWLSDLKAEPDMVEVAAIIQPTPVCPRIDLDGDGTRECDPAPDCECTLNRQGLDYIDLVNVTGGKLYDIDANVWAPALEEISTLGAGLARVFHLPTLPAPSTLRVWVEDDGNVFDFTLGVDFEYDAVRNAIVFDTYTPRASAAVNVRYTVLSQ